MTRALISAALLAATLATATTAAPDIPVTAELLPGWREDGRHIAGLRLVLDPGWKTYWRAPGDAGIPPAFDWSRSGNLKGAEVAFPVPGVFDVSGVTTIGYQDEVVFPLTLMPADAAMPITLDAEVQIGVCEDVCIPVTFRVSGDLPPGGAPDAALAAARADQPRRGGAMTCRIAPIADGLRLEVEVAMPVMAGAAQPVIETADPSVWVSPAEVVVSGGRMSAVVELVPPDAVPFALERDGLRLTLIGQGDAVEMRGCD